MAKIPKLDPFDELNLKVTKQELRPYLGLSGIGHSCHRYLQYYHYWAFYEYHESRMLRLFGVGHRSEDTMKADLLTIGIDTHGDQTEIIGAGGHWRGHIDDLGYFLNAEFEEFLVEYKTHSDANFKAMKKGSIKRTKSMHYDQMQSYIDGLGLKKGLYMAENKNTSAYHFEWIEKDEERISELKMKQMEVIASDVLLPRVGSNSKTWFECKMCSASEVCFNGKAPPVTCRTCKHVDVIDCGNWVCTLGGAKHLSTEDQRQACSHYDLAVMFL
jgi:hypothetical protein